MRSLAGFFSAGAAVLAAAAFTGLLVPAGIHAQNAKVPRTSDGKPDFSGTFEWPKSIGGPKCKCSATIFDKSKFAPLKAGGEPFFEPRTGDPQHDEPRSF
jgi:hypothetical protein